MKHIADRLEIAQGNNNAEELIPEAIAMLRTQQAEIEALKQQLVTTSSEAKLNYNKGHEDGRKLSVVKELKIHEDIVYGLAYKHRIEKGDVQGFAKELLRKAQEK